VADNVGALAGDLESAIALALTRDRAVCAAYGRTFTWGASAQQFIAALSPVRFASEPELCLV
jgi:hypothetical protein